MFKILILIFLTLFPGLSFSWDFADFKEEAVSPYTTDAKYVLISGSAITLGLVIFEDAIIDPFQEKQARNKTLGDSSRYGDWLGQLIPNVLYASGMAMAGSKERAIGMFKATTYASGATNILKYTIAEPRPYNHHRRNSFPSGHTTTAFAFSGYVTAEHGWGWGVPSVLLATFIGYSRINDNRHWLHDVTAGATIGWAYGWGISKLSRQKSEAEKNKEATQGTTNILPLYDSKTIGLSLYRDF